MPFEDLLLGLLPEPLQLGDLARLARGLQLVDRCRCPGRSYRAFTFFGPSPGSRSISTSPAGTDARRSSRYGSWPVVTSVVIFSRSASPIPRTSPSLPSATSCFEVAGELARRSGRRCGRRWAEGVLALQFEQGADLVEGGGDVVLGHGRLPRACVGAYEPACSRNVGRSTDSPRPDGVRAARRRAMLTPRAAAAAPAHGRGRHRFRAGAWSTISSPFTTRSRAAAVDQVAGAPGHAQPLHRVVEQQLRPPRPAARTVTSAAAPR